MFPRALVPATLLTIALAMGGCKGQDKPAAEAPAVLTVSTTAVTARELARELSLTGSVAAWEPLPVMPAANGLRIVQVLAEEGQTVRKGQLLARLDDATLQAQLAAAKARASSAAAQLAKMQRPSRRQDLATAQAALAQAEAQLRSAEDTYQRFKAIHAEGGVSEAELVTRETAVASARAAAEQARARLSLAVEGSRSEDLRIAEAQAAEARASVAQMEALLAQTRVVAPDGGLVIKRDAHLGDVSSVGKPLFQVVRNGRLEIEAKIPEHDLGRVKPGQAAVITSDARPDLVVTGKVRRISPSLEAASRQGTVEIDLPANSGYQVGMFVKASVNLGTTQTLAVPAAAVVSREAGSQVFVLDGQIARARPVVETFRKGGWVGLAGGVKPGEAVIDSGVGFLKDGDKVDVVPALEGGS